MFYSKLSLWGIILLLVILGGLLWERSSLKANNARLSASVATLSAAQARAEETARVHRAHIQRQLRADAERSQRQHQLQLLEGRDAPLSDHMRDASGLLWP